MTSLTELVATALAATRERLESVENSMTELKTDMTELKTDMTERFASMSSGFTARFDQLDAAVSELRNERGT